MTYEELVKAATDAFNNLSRDMKRAHMREQAISFVYGNLKLDGCDVTREQVATVYDAKRAKEER